MLAKLDGVDAGKVNKRALCDPKYCVLHLNKYTMTESESVLFKVVA